MLARVFLLALTALGSLVGGVSADTDGQTDNGDDFYLDWHPQYGTGLIPAAFEAAVAAELGPYMFNAMFPNTTSLQARDGSNVTELGGCFGCLATVAKELPCIYYAVKGGGFDSLTKCGVGKPDLCECVDCLPSVVSRYISGYCDSDAGNDQPVTTELVHDSFVKTPDLEAKAFLGTLTNDDVDTIKRVVTAVQPTAQPQKRDDQRVGCVFGSPGCSGCQGCCLGPCLFGSCIGICA
ncbi:hypothetical protein DB88DRAFT_508109 [Papiliotrema laurentii]|uniref:Uncharacterized protein n=1 Tax=Papiliotrema laurentii TaxID=5418 RepID=A0AAD9FXX6_PAPLA|nr:hypothetical protein DB88DRAFT_508109 [Papiliotrema laurentii]